MHNLPKLCIVLYCILFFYIPTTQGQVAVIDSILSDTSSIRLPQRKIRAFTKKLLSKTGKQIKSYKPVTRVYQKFDGHSFWKKTNQLGLNLTEVAFVNWNAGGNNSISALASLNFVRKYKYRYVQWDNQLTLKYGINAQDGKRFRKTTDEIRFVSTFGYRRDTISNWFYSVKTNFKSQFTHGYKYPNTEKPISKFMAPGYFFFGAGTEYSLDKKNKNFNLYTSPITLKATFVLDQELANSGAFGVQKAQYDTEGNLLQPGKQSVQEFGMLLTSTWKKELLKNITLDHRIQLYSDYLNSFGNIDVDWEINLNFMINKIFKAHLGAHLLYDDDVRFDVIKDDNGLIVDNGSAKTQFK